MSVNRFGRAARLTTAADYQQVFGRKNLRLNNRHWTILVVQSHLTDAGVGEARMGLAIGKKRAKRAIDRNRFKRILRECFRLRRAELPPVDLVVMNRDACIGATRRELRDSANDLLNRIIKQCSG